MSNEVAKKEATAVAKKEAPLKDLLKSEAFTSTIDAFFLEPKNRDRFVQTAVNAIMKTPMLAQCNKVSFFNALKQLASFGLDPDGRNAHLIPFKNNKMGTVDCTLIIDYKGMVTLAMRSHNISKVEAFCVYKNDEFYVDDGEVHHRITDPFGDRGDLVGFWSVCQFKDGVRKFEWMSKAEVDKIRARSRSANNGPWVTDYNEMGKKTVFKRLTKWMPITPELQAVIDKDNEEYVSSVQEERSKRVKASDLLKKKPVVEEPEAIEAEAEVVTDEAEEAAN